MPDAPDFVMDAVRLDRLSDLRGDLRLPYVLSTPWACPGYCSASYALLVNIRVVFDIEMGKLGQKHLACLAEAMKSLCNAGRQLIHLRTDGHTVWEPESLDVLPCLDSPPITKPT